MDTDELCKALTAKFPKIELYRNEPMKKHTSFKIGGNADVFIKAKNVDEIKEVLRLSNEYNIPLNIIGNGSNLLVRDEGVKGIVLKVCIEYYNIEEYTAGSENNKVVVTAGSGVLLGKLAQMLLRESISGFEFASGIPGTIGGAVRMNAGAYGLEFKDIVIQTTVLNRNGEIIKFSNAEQKFNYRTSVFKNKEYIILETTLLLNKVEDTNTIKEKMDEYKKSRVEKQPIEYPSAGSTFKRGQDFITAKLIDECGLKGLKVGDAQVSTKHAGFIINLGNATSKDVLELVEIVKNTVFEKCGKRIELEVEIM